MKEKPYFGPEEGPSRCVQQRDRTTYDSLLITLFSVPHIIFSLCHPALLSWHSNSESANDNRLLTLCNETCCEHRFSTPNKKTKST